MSNHEAQILSLVVPFHNDGATLPKFFTRVLPILESLRTTQFEIVCVNDGSTDDTLAQLVELARQDSRIRVVDLTRSFGREAALTAGIDEAAGDAVVPIGADLQDPPELIPAMVQRWRQGAEVVLAQWMQATEGSRIRRLFAGVTYRLQSGMSDLSIPPNVAEFRLMDRAVVNALKQLPERHRFMKGLFAWVGFNTVTVQYERTPAIGDTPRRSGRWTWRPASERITSFSSVPLRCLTFLGTCTAALAICYGIYVAACDAVFGRDVSGDTWVFALLLCFGGLQLLGLGMLGAYIRRIYDESKGRPIYLVKRRYQGQRSHGREVGEGKVISLLATKRG
ncbi:putative glycosyltransferase [compost metagenome]